MMVTRSKTTFVVGQTTAKLNWQNQKVSQTECGDDACISVMGKADFPHLVGRSPKSSLICVPR